MVKCNYTFHFIQIEINTLKQRPKISIPNFEVVKLTNLTKPKTFLIQYNQLLTLKTTKKHTTSVPF